MKKLLCILMVMFNILCICPLSEASSESAYLSSLSVRGKAVEGFSPDVFEYYIFADDGEVLPNSGESTDMKIIPVAEDEKASVNIDYGYFYDGENTLSRSAVIRITVTSESGLYTNTYTVYYFHPKVLPVDSDSDVRGKNQGNYPLVYTTDDIYSVLGFDLRYIYKPEIIEDICLNLNVSSTEATEPLRIYAGSNNWKEYEITKDNYIYDDSQLIYEGNISSNLRVRAVVTGYIKDAIAKGEDYVTFILGKNKTTTYSSRENKYPALKPMLIISYSEDISLIPEFPDYHSLDMQKRPPDNYNSFQNPPDFSWKYIEGATYDIKVCGDKNLSEVLYEKSGIPRNVYNFPYEFESGKEYYWAVRYFKEGKYSDWSAPSRFRIDETAVPFPVDIEKILSHLTSDVVHPGLLVNESFDKTVINKNRSAFKSLKSKAINVKNAGIPDAFGYVEATAENTDEILKYKDAANNLSAVALYYWLTGEEDFGKFGVELLENLSSRNPEECFIFNQYSDTAESLFAYSYALSYDFLYGLLSEEQKTSAVSCIERNIKRCYEQFFNGKTLSLYKRPFNSHAWRMNGCVIAALAICDVSDYAAKIIEYHLPLMINLINPYVYQDGSNSQGPFYGMANDLLEQFYILENKGILKMNSKAYIRNRAYTNLYLWPYNWINMIGDSYNSKPQGSYQNIIEHQALAYCLENPLMSSINKRLYEKINGSGEYYYEKNNGTLFFNCLSETVNAEPVMLPDSKFFKDTGWVASYSDINDDNKTGIIFKSSQYGSNNHSHPDQNSFVIQKNGEVLAKDSDYYDSYHSQFDVNWNKKTYAHNAITFDGGKGQNYNDIRAKGKITDYLNTENFTVMKGDATAAYDGELGKAERTVIYLRPGIFIISDKLSSAYESEKSFEWWLNTDGEFSDVKSDSAVISKIRSKMKVEMLYPDVTSEVTEGFVTPEGTLLTPPENAENAKDKRICFKTEKTTETDMVTVLNTENTEDEFKNISCMKNEDFVKLLCENREIYINLKNEEVSDSIISTDGEAVIMGKDETALINGSFLDINGVNIISSDVPCSVILDGDFLSLSSVEKGATVKISGREIKKAALIRDEVFLPLDSGVYKHGVMFNAENDDVLFRVYPGTYSFLCNGMNEEKRFRVELKTEGDGKIYGLTGGFCGVSNEYIIKPGENSFIESVSFNGKNVMCDLKGEQSFKTPPITEDSEIFVSFRSFDGAPSVSISDNYVKSRLYKSDDKIYSVVFAKIFGDTEKITDAGMSLNGKKYSVGKHFINKIKKDKYFGIGLNFNENSGIINLLPYISFGGEDVFGNSSLCNTEAELTHIYQPYDEKRDVNINNVRIDGKVFGEFTPYKREYFIETDSSRAVIDYELSSDLSVASEEVVINESGFSYSLIITVTSVTGEKGTYVFNFSNGKRYAVEDADIRETNRKNSEVVYVTPTISSIIKFNIENMGDFEKCIFKGKISYGYGTEGNLYLYEAGSEWSENEIDNFNAAPFGKLLGIHKIPAMRFGEFETDITDYVKRALSEDEKYLSVGITADTMETLYFAAHEYGGQNCFSIIYE